MSLRKRLLYTVALLALLATGVFSLQVYRLERQQLFDQFASAMNLAGIAEIRSIQGQIRRHVASIRFIEKQSSVRRLVEELDKVDGQVSASGEAQRWRSLVEEDFRAIMSANPDYLQLRIIGTANHGREVVRINRHGNELETMSASQMQEKGSRDYFVGAAEQPPGALYISALGLNREHGRIEVPHVPTYRIAVPLYSAAKRLHGIAIINIDAKSSLLDIGDAAARFAPDYKVQTLMVTAPGDWVVHPDASFLYGTDLNSGHSLAQDQPLLQRMAEDAIAHAEATGNTTMTRRIPDLGLVHLNLLRVDQGEEARYLSLFHVLAEGEIRTIVGAQAWPLIIVASLLSILLVIPVLMFLNRQLAPLLQITHSARKAATGHYDVDLPKSTNADEVGLLSKAFQALIGDVKAREQAMHEANEFLAVVLQGIAEGVAAVDGDGNILRVNAAMARIFGYEPGELEQMNVDSLVPGDARAQHADVRATFAQRPKARRLGGGRQLYGLRKDGSVFPVDLALTPTRQGARALTIVTAIDVTEREASEREIRELNQTLEQRVVERTSELEDARRRIEIATNAAGIGIWELDVASNSVSWDEWMHALHGTDPGMSGDLLQKFWSEELHPEDRESTKQMLADAIAGRGKFDTEFRIRLPDGTERWIKADATVITDAAGKAIRVIGTNLDISEIKQSEAMMKEARDAALQASRAKGDFLANMSHEIRTPMNGIIGMSNLLLDTELDDQQRIRAHAIRGSAEALLTIINDILDFSKVEAGKIDIEPIDFDLAHLLSDLAASMAVKAHEKGIELVCPDSILPPEFTFFHADAGRLRQVLFNLIGNAIKFTNEGEVTVSFTVSGSTDSLAHVRFDVRDTGVGIDKDVQGRLFERFMQADSSTTRIFGGTGLGLAISRHLVELMGGEIGVESEPGKGSNFWFTLPLERVAASAMTAPPPSPTGDGHRVLLVDDVSSTRALMAQLLDFWGVDFDQAASADEALIRLVGALEQKKPFQVAVIDQHLGLQSGLELIQTIRADSRLRELAIVVLRSPGHEADTPPVVNGEALPSVDKPLTQSVFFNTLAIELGVIKPSPDYQQRAHSGAPQQYRARALVVEDNPTNRLVARGLLERFGLTVEVVGNGQEAVEQLTLGDYDVVFMDVHMPVMDGYTATGIIRDAQSSVLRHDVPVIAMTANAVAGEREKSLAAGMSDHLPKPVDTVRLAATLQRWLPASARLPAEAPGTAREGSPNAGSSASAVQDSEAALAVFDRAELRSRVFDDDSLVGQLIAMYLNDGPRMFGELCTAMESDDAEKMAFAAHAMKGSALSIGAPRLAAICLRMETAARDSDKGAVLADWPSAQQAYAELIERLKQEAA